MCAKLIDDSADEVVDLIKAEDDAVLIGDSHNLACTSGVSWAWRRIA
jgi:hypothetical protein